MLFYSLDKNIGEIFMSDTSYTVKDFDNIYKKIEEKVKSKNVDKNSSTFLLYQKQLKALSEIKEYIDSYCWIKREDEKEKLKFLREVDFDYNVAMDNYKVSKNSLVCFMYRESKKLNEKIGDNTISLILSDKDLVSDGLVNFRIKTGVYSLEKILMKETFESLPEEEMNLFDFKDCRNEILYLYTYSKIAREFAYEDISENKLAYVLYILTHELKKKKYRDMKKLLLSLLQGVNISIEDFMEKLENGDYDKDSEYEDYI